MRPMGTHETQRHYWILIRIRETKGDQRGLMRLRETNGDS